MARSPESDRPALSSVLGDYAASLAQPAFGGDDATFDELVSPDGSLRPGWRGLAERAVQMSVADLQRIDADIRQGLADDGVTYGRPGTSPAPWRLDVLPLVVDAAEWAPLEVGLTQRSELLNAILVDLYGPQRLLSEGILPPALVFGHPGFMRAVANRSRPDAQPLLLAAADVGRNASGDWVVLADRVQAPSGIGFAMENRRVLSRAVPELYRGAGLHQMAPYFQALRSALLQSAADETADPRVVVLSPGSDSETAYDQAFMASILGFPLVQGSDLQMRDGAIWMKAFGRLERVDVILRRVDAAWSDPLELRGDSRLGVAGLTEAVRRGTVRVVNGLGSGVLENAGLLPYMSAMCEKLLDEPLRLPSLRTSWCGDPKSLDYVLGHLDDLDVRSIDESVDLSGLSRSDLTARLNAQPHMFVGQDRLDLSQSPVFDGARLSARTISLRTFALRYGPTFRPLAGGLVEVTDRDGATSSKDLWVLKDDPDSPDQGLAGVLPITHAQAPVAMVPRVLDDLWWLGRYSERAEQMSRLALVTHSLSEDYGARPYSSGALALRVMLSAIDRLSLSPVEPDSVDDNLRSLILDPHRLGSVAQSSAGLRRAAEGVRDQLSPDLFRTFSALDRAAAALLASRHGHQIADSAGHILTALLAVDGVTSNMMRDPGWHMIRLGRSIERGMQLCHLLRSTATIRRGIDADRDVHQAVLTAAESSITYRRRYRDYIRTAGVLELLLLDVDNPRSLSFAMSSIREHLVALPASTGSTRPERLLDDLVEEMGRVDAATLVAIEGEHRPNLERFLDGCNAQLERIADAVIEVHATVGPAPRTFGFGA